MKKTNAFISGFLSLVLMAAIMLPSLHAFEHNATNTDEGFSFLTEKFASPIIDCDLCDFNISYSETPDIFSYTLHLPQKEIIHIISLAETVHLYPDTLFSLRAPPAVIS